MRHSATARYDGAMSGFARVESVETIAAFKGALLKFAEAANVALADAEGELSRTEVWLEGEQRTHWHSQVRKCTEAVGRAKEAVRMKKLGVPKLPGASQRRDLQRARSELMRRDHGSAAADGQGTVYCGNAG